MSGDGRRLVTVERRVGEHGVRRTSLKFWERQAGGGQHFALSAVVDSPHEGQGQGALLAVAYHPTRDLVATASASGAFGLWACLAEEDEDGDGSRRGVGRARWVCQATVPFHRGPCRCLAFSGDGTLLAVGCGRAVALWDPLAVRLLTVLADPRETEAATAARGWRRGRDASDVDELDVLSVAFLPRCPRLVCATQRAMVVWDLLSLSPVQRYEAGRVAYLCAAVGPATAASSQGFAVQGEAVHFAAVLTGAEEEKALQLRHEEGKTKARQHKHKGGRHHQHHQHQPQPQQTIVAFNAFKAAPLLTYPLPKTSPPLLALAMTEGPAATGLCYMTRDGVTLIGEPSACLPHYRRQPALPGGGSRKRGAPASGAVAAVELAGGGGGGKTKRPRLAAAAAAAAERPGKAASIAELLGTTTGHLPPPSAVFDSFLAGLLPASLPPPEAPTLSSAPATASSTTTSSSSSKPVVPAASSAAGASVAPGPTALPSTGVRKDLLQLLTEEFRRKGAAVTVTTVAKPGKEGKTPKKKQQRREEEAAELAPVQQDDEDGAEDEQPQPAPTENGVEETPKGRASSRRRSNSVSSGSARKQRKS